MKYRVDPGRNDFALKEKQEKDKKRSRRADLPFVSLFLLYKVLTCN